MKKKANNVAIALVILAHKAKNIIEPALQALQQQTLMPTQILIIDSVTAEDDIAAIAKGYGMQYHAIKPSEFDHGDTRQLALDLVKADFYIFMTQDAVLADKDAIKNLMEAFKDPKVGCAYGRQLPMANANALATHARLFNYPAASVVKSFADKDNYGIKTCFNSDSFAAYREQALNDIGGFPNKCIMGEDVIVAAKILLLNWKVAYQAEAMVYHSHNYKITQEFKRYFDIGVFHAMNPWIIENFSNPTGEGKRYVKSEWKFCLNHHAYLALMKSCVSIVAKYLGYYFGKKYLLLSKKIKRKFSMNSFYWK